MKKIDISTSRRTEFLDCTELIGKAVREWEMEQGLVVVYVPHTTAGVTINENADPSVMADMDKALDRIVPWQAGYSHAEGNAAAHVKASMMGSSVQLVVAGGSLQLGTWQGVYFCEFDGPRQRRIWVERVRSSPE